MCLVYICKSLKQCVKCNSRYLEYDLRLKYFSQFIVIGPGKQLQRLNETSSRFGAERNVYIPPTPKVQMQQTRGIMLTVVGIRAWSITPQYHFGR